jgi:lysophospholipase L1-like esterase
VGATSRALSEQIAGAQDALAGANLVFVSMGANDAVGVSTQAGFMRRLTEGYEKLRAAAPRAHVVTLGIPDVSVASVLKPNLKAWATARADVFRPIQHEASQRFGFDFVDTADVVNRKLGDNAEYLSADGFHPNAAGYDVSAQLIFDDLMSSHG